MDLDALQGTDEADLNAKHVNSKADRIKGSHEEEDDSDSPHADALQQVCVWLRARRPLER